MAALYPLSVRLDPDKLKRARKLVPDLPEFFRESLDNLLKEQKCPTCGTHMGKPAKKGVGKTKVEAPDVKY